MEMFLDIIIWLAIGIAFALLVPLLAIVVMPIAIFVGPWVLGYIIYLNSNTSANIEVCKNKESYFRKYVKCKDDTKIKPKENE